MLESAAEHFVDSNLRVPLYQEHALHTHAIFNSVTEIAS